MEKGAKRLASVSRKANQMSETAESKFFRDDPEYSNPTPSDLKSPIFEAVWQAIKGWDISRYKDGFYSGPTGNDVMHILQALDAQRTPCWSIEEVAGGYWLCYNRVRLIHSIHDNLLPNFRRLIELVK